MTRPGPDPLPHAVAQRAHSAAAFLDAEDVVVVHVVPDTRVAVVALYGRGRDRCVMEGAFRAGLSPREREVAVRLARGARNAEIAQALGITTTTTRHHVERILTKLGVRSRHDVAPALRRAASRHEKQHPRLR